MRFSLLVCLPLAAAINRGGEHDAATLKAILSRRLKANMGGGGGGAQPAPVTVEGGAMAKGGIVVSWLVDSLVEIFFAVVA